jgi:hypothetical protein
LEVLEPELLFIKGIASPFVNSGIVRSSSSFSSLSASSPYCLWSRTAKNPKETF